MAADPKDPRADRGDDEAAPVTPELEISEIPEEELTPEQLQRKKDSDAVRALRRTVSSTVIRAEDVLKALQTKTGRPPPPLPPRPASRPKK